MGDDRRTLTPTPVRRSVCRAREKLDHVGIDDDRIEELAAEWASTEFRLPDWRAPVFPDESAGDTSAEDVLDVLFLGNSINFAFREFSSGEDFLAAYDDTEWSGAFGMWACLKRAYDRGTPILDGEYLSTLSRADVETLFEPADGTPMPMLDERLEILRQVGDRLTAAYGGRFHNFLAECPPRLFADGEGIVERLVEEFPSFDDTGTLRGPESALDVSFYKRAQLAPAMAYGRFEGSATFELRDPGAFTVFADYNLPNVLRHLGVFEYDSALCSTIDSGEVIEAGSRQEVELRVATVVAGDLLMETVNQRRESPIHGPHVDYELFSLRDDADTPVHKTRTTAY